MQISVRKARRLEQQINNLVRSTRDSISYVAQFSRYESYSDEQLQAEMERVVQVAEAKINDLLRLNEIRFNIRRNIAVANREGGVDALIAHNADLNIRIAMFAGNLTRSTTVESLPSVKATAAEIADAENRTGGYSLSSSEKKNININCYTTATMNENLVKVAEWTRVMTKNSDNLIELNSKLSITISDSDVEFLLSKNVIL